ncbi:cysteine hydrolase family protein [Acuticoccus sediminis]|uniref:cysteine hydrolase family protein n=1 Tax=Acuticoccus sediminis TaxID=2184697 RepID=UPI0013912881|nr:isochorismatase family cysteine hydrolase [Acuticoccus sediminis]
MISLDDRTRSLDDVERLDPAHTALVLIDIQNDFCHPDGAFGRIGSDLSMMPAMAREARRLRDSARDRGIVTFYVRATYDPEVLGAPLAETYARRGFSDGQCPEGSWGADWYDGLSPDPERAADIVVTKHRFSVFQGTEIDLYLRANGIRTVVFAGVVTSGCVESSLRDAFFRDYYVVAAEDAMTEASPERHRASLHKIGQAFGEVRPAAAIAGLWLAANGPGADLSIAAKAARIPGTLADRIDPAHTALLLIDLQEDFCATEGVMGRNAEDLSDIARAVKGCQRLLGIARAAGLQVIHLRAEYGEADASPVSIFASADVDGMSCCRPGTSGARILPEVAPVEGEWEVVKRRFSGFVDTRLELMLRSNGIRTLIVGGVATQCCVESTVRDAALRDYFVVVASDACGARGRMRHLHDASLEVMGLYFAEVCPIDRIESALAPAKTAA